MDDLSKTSIGCDLNDEMMTNVEEEMKVKKIKFKKI
jgi:hypothetical protein